MNTVLTDEQLIATVFHVLVWVREQVMRDPYVLNHPAGRLTSMYLSRLREQSTQSEFDDQEPRCCK